MELDTVHCCDCLDFMRELPDGCVDAVVTDPPYGIGEAAGKNKSRGKLAIARDYGSMTWDDDRPSPEVFAQLLRVAGEAVIFGGNYFADLLPSSSSWIVWDKDNTGDFADCELAWTSHKRAVRKVKWRWNGMLQEPGVPKDVRRHPTQKPLGLMVWILRNYCESTDVILDPFCGSGTTLVAAKKLGLNYIGCDISPDYCAIAERRLAEVDGVLFSKDGEELATQVKLF